MEPPREVSEVKGKDPGTYLQFNTHMVTFYQQTYGELSRFFLALRDGRLIGSHCGKCKQVMVPAATWHCPTCDFAEMKEVDLPHRGVLAATAPITIFPSASFIGDAPFARGYVDVATDAPIASFLPSRLRTTTGLPRPGIFVKGLELKLVFEDTRIGSIRDIFWVPMSEVPAKLRDKQPLLASALNFETPPAPAVERSKAGEKATKDALAAMKTLAGKIGKSPRPRRTSRGGRTPSASRPAAGTSRSTSPRAQSASRRAPEEAGLRDGHQGPGDLYPLGRRRLADRRRGGREPLASPQGSLRHPAHPRPAAPVGAPAT